MRFKFIYYKYKYKQREDFVKNKIKGNQACQKSHKIQAIETPITMHG